MKLRLEDRCSSRLEILRARAQCAAARLSIAALLSFVSAGAVAAEGPDSQVPWSLGEALRAPERLELSFDQRTRYEYIDNQFRADRPGDDQLLLLRTRVRARLRLVDWLTVGAEFQDSRAYLADDNSPVGTGMVNAAELLRAYLELRLQGPFEASHTLQLGRMTLDVGSRRFVARNGFRNTSNAFTGFDWRVRTKRDHDFRFFFTLPVQRLPEGRDRILDNDVEFDQESDDFLFSGIFFGTKLPWGDDFELYAFGIYERSVLDEVEPEGTPFRKLGSPGFRYRRAPAPGRFDIEFETVLQAGRSRLERTGSRDLEHFAHFHHLTLGYTFDAAWSPRVLVMYDYASGDEDPFDGSNQRFDSLFGGRRFELGPTSLYGPWGRENINTPSLRLDLSPDERWITYLAYRAVWLASRRDEWVRAGVWDPTGRSGNFVGQQLDFRIRWRVLPGNLNLELGYAHLFAGEFIDEAPNSNGGDSNYVYTQFLLQF